MSHFQKTLDRDVAEGRISVELVEAAYRISQIRPKRAEYYDRAGHAGCAMGAIYLASGGTQVDDKCATVNAIWQYCARKWRSRYLNDFSDGFDVACEPAEGDPIGFIDGCAAAHAVFGLGHADGSAAP